MSSIKTPPLKIKSFRLPERRSARRIPYRGYVNKVQGGIAAICRAVDLSRSGIAFEQLAGPGDPEGRVLAIEFQLPNSDEVLLARGRATRRQDRSWGMKFTSISPRHRAMIDGYIAAARLTAPA